MIVIPVLKALWVLGQSDLQLEVQASKAHIVRPCLKKKHLVLKDGRKMLKYSPLPYEGVEMTTHSHWGLRILFVSTFYSLKTLKDKVTKA